MIKINTSLTYTVKLISKELNLSGITVHIKFISLEMNFHGVTVRTAAGCDEVRLRVVKRGDDTGRNTPEIPFGILIEVSIGFDLVT